MFPVISRRSTRWSGAGQHLRQHEAGTRAGAGARPGRGADHVEPLDRCAVARPAEAGPEEKVLIEMMAAAEAIAADEIRIVALEIGRRVHGAAENGRGESGRITLDDADDSIGIRFFHLVPIGAADRSRRVAANA